MLPNLLTLSRILVIPIIMACFYFDGQSIKYIAATLYVCACITDFFDGYLARQWHQISDFGKIFDPIADKLLVAIVLLMLSGHGVVYGIHLIPSAVILAREILVSGLRSYLAQIQQIIPVTKFSKWKTFTQMLAISCLLFAYASENTNIFNLGLYSLWLSSIFTIITGYRYARKGLLILYPEIFK